MIKKIKIVLLDQCRHDFHFPCHTRLYPDRLFYLLTMCIRVDKNIGMSRLY